MGSRAHHRLPRLLRGNPVSGEDGERLAFQGPRGRQGNQGDRGERGASGLSGPVRLALVFLFALSVTLGGLSLFWTAHEVHVSQAAVQAAQQREQDAQRRAGAQVEKKLCTTLGRLTALKPPAGSASANPSRAYEQELHATLAQLGPDLGCKGPRS